MPSITDLNYTDNFASNKRPFLTDLRSALDSIETHINDKLGDNLVQLAKDAYGSAYTFDNDGAAQYTNNLYEKQNSSSDYSAATFTLTSNAAFADVDSANAKITFTPELVGDFRVTFNFSVSVTTSNATNEAFLYFRLTDGTTNSTAVTNLRAVSGVSGSVYNFPIVVADIFANLAASSQTLKLQYYFPTATAVTVVLQSTSTSPLHMVVEKV